VTPTVAEAVHRALARDTMLTLAHDAEEAMTIVSNRDREAIVSESALFELAVERYLVQADAGRQPESGADQNWSFRSAGNAHAATILRFCDFMGIPLGPGLDVEGRYETALAELRPAAGRPALDRFAEVNITYRLVRSLRLANRVDDALRLSSPLDPDFFYASGAEPRSGDMHFETGAALLAKGQPRQVFTALGELEQTYWVATKASSFSTRHRYAFILGLADQALGRTDAAIERLEWALEHLAERRIPDTRHDVYELSLKLAFAELLAATGRQTDRAASVAAAALDIAEQIRGRWGVIARARTPLSVAFRRVYGDAALLAAALPGAAAARLGLRVCLSAKQTGFASHMRAGDLLLAGPLRGLVTDVLAAEGVDPQDLSTDVDALREQRARQDRKLDMLRRRIEKAITPMLADTILPTPPDMNDLLAAIGPRYALDYAGLPDTLAKRTNWFHTLTEPTGTVHFEQFHPGEHFGAYFEERDGQAPWMDRLAHAGRDNHPDWYGLAQEVLPGRLLDLLRHTGDDEPIELVVSAHQVLSMLPWVALEIDGTGTQLLRRAVLTQTPVLTCLCGKEPPTVTGPALVRLVAPAEGGVRIERESWTWRLPLTDGLAALSRCTLDDLPPHAVAHPTVSSALADADADWELVHIATHGYGTGFDQYLNIPEETATGGRLSAAQALALRWPSSTVMASCKVGRLVNVADAEPLSFVTAVLTAGSRCVVAPIDTVLDISAGRMAAHLVERVRRSPVRLEYALREAQIEYAVDRVASWALFNAYVT
jgi:tetratricopeptide (TPR) repeat protein